MIIIATTNNGLFLDKLFLQMIIIATAVKGLFLW